MPLLEAMSRAREGDDSRCRALSLAAVMADVVVVLLGEGVSSVDAVASVALASSLGSLLVFGAMLDASAIASCS